VCSDFHDRHTQLEGADGVRYVEANAAYMARQCAFIRPAFQAALELDSHVAWEHIRVSIERGLDSCTRPLALALPQCTAEEIESLGRQVRRTFFSALIDTSVTPDELRRAFLSLIHGWPLTVGEPPQRKRPMPAVGP
jgi:hypothetical protein